MIGPKKNYKYYGYGNFSAGAGLNSVKVFINIKARYTIRESEQLSSLMVVRFNSTSVMSSTITVSLEL